MNVLAAEWSKEIFLSSLLSIRGIMEMFLEASVSHLRKAVEPATFQSKFLGSNAVKVKLIASQLNNEQEASRCVVYGRN